MPFISCLLSLSPPGFFFFFFSLLSLLLLFALVLASSHIRPLVRRRAPRKMLKQCKEEREREESRSANKQKKKRSWGDERKGDWAA